MLFHLDVSVWENNSQNIPLKHRNHDMDEETFNSDAQRLRQVSTDTSCLVEAEAAEIITAEGHKLAEQ